MEITASRILQHFTEYLERTSSRTSISSTGSGPHYDSEAGVHQVHRDIPPNASGRAYLLEAPLYSAFISVESGLDNISGGTVCHCARDLGEAATDACRTRVLLVMQSDGTH